jgi:hypothetical protein
MTSARKRGLVILSIVVIAAALLALSARTRTEVPPARSANQRPALLLLTSLPLVFGDGFSLEETGSPALKALETRYRVLPISVTSETELAKGKLLLMAQPIAQTPENLVALDDWVRAGGRILLLADPMLEWPSDRPLGDRLRPPIMFADTGLLAHWGLRLDAPDRRGLATRRLAGRQIVTLSPGALVGHCKVAADRFVANCQLGTGRAVIIADADLLKPPKGESPDGALNAILDELADLERES